jgi:hypothetical protein
VELLPFSNRYFWHLADHYFSDRAVKLAFFGAFHEIGSSKNVLKTKVSKPTSEDHAKWLGSLYKSYIQGLPFSGANPSVATFNYMYNA